MVKFPEIEVQLIGTDGNAWSIMGLVAARLRAGGVSAEEIQVYMDESKAGDYDALLQTAMRWVEVS